MPAWGGSGQPAPPGEAPPPAAAGVAPPATGRGPSGRLLESRRLLTLVLLAVFFWGLLNIDWSGALLHDGGAEAVTEIAVAAVSPDLSMGTLGTAIAAMWTTVAYAVAGMTVALFIGLPLGVLASGVLATSSVARRASTGTFRLVLAFFRSIHELVWAWLFVAAFGLSPMAAVLALGIPYGGILGRIYSELLQDVPDGPLQALRRAGATETRLFWYGRLPMALPDMASYTFYRLECGIRSAAIMSFVGLGGLGHHIQLALDDLNYERAWTFLLLLVVLVIAVDAWSTLVRRRMAA